MTPKLLLLLAAAAATAAATPGATSGATPPPVFPIADYTTLVEKVANGSRLTVARGPVAVPGGTLFQVVHLYGDTQARGYAYGWLMADRVEKMMADLDVFYRDEVDSIPWARPERPWFGRPLARGQHSCTGRPATPGALDEWCCRARLVNIEGLAGCEAVASTCAGVSQPVVKPHVVTGLWRTSLI
jgi:hypothetical protein